MIVPGNTADIICSDRHADVAAFRDLTFLISTRDSSHASVTVHGTRVFAFGDTAFIEGAYSARRSCRPHFARVATSDDTALISAADTSGSGFTAKHSGRVVASGNRTGFNLAAYAADIKASSADLSEARASGDRASSQTAAYSSRHVVASMKDRVDAATGQRAVFRSAGYSSVVCAGIKTPAESASADRGLKAVTADAAVR